MALTINNLPYPVGTDKVVDGDNAIRALAEALKIWTARISIPAPTGGAIYKDVPVTFPVGLFSAAPVVAITPVANTSGSTLIMGIGGNVSATGFTLRAVAGSGATWGQVYTAQVIAIQIS